MALIKCPECGKEISASASACPHCGYPIKEAKPVTYETTTVKIRCWGRSASALNDKLQPYIKQGWEVVSTVEDHLLGGWLSPVYKVILRRPKKS